MFHNLKTENAKQKPIPVDKSLYNIPHLEKLVHTSSIVCSTAMPSFVLLAYPILIIHNKTAK